MSFIEDVISDGRPAVILEDIHHHLTVSKDVYRKCTRMSHF